MATKWKKAGNYKDIIYEKMDGIAKVTINRPEVRNAFRPNAKNKKQFTNHHQYLG